MGRTEGQRPPTQEARGNHVQQEDPSQGQNPGRGGSPASRRTRVGHTLSARRRLRWTWKTGRRPCALKGHRLTARGSQNPWERSVASAERREWPNQRRAVYWVSFRDSSRVPECPRSGCIEGPGSPQGIGKTGPSEDCPSYSTSLEMAWRAPPDRSKHGACSPITYENDRGAIVGVQAPASV